VIEGETGRLTSAPASRTIIVAMLSAEAVAVLLALLVNENRHEGGVPIVQIARASELPERRCVELLESAELAAFVRMQAAAPGRSLDRAAKLTGEGRDRARSLCVAPASGPLSQFTDGLSEIKRAALDVAVETQQRFRGGTANRSQIRTTIRKRILPEPSLDVVTTEVEALVPSHLAIASSDPSYWVTLQGLLASRWGQDALKIVACVLDVLRDVHGVAGRFQYGWRELQQKGVHRSAFNLVDMTIALAGLGQGPYDHSGDDWWRMPADPDVLCEMPALAYVISRLLLSEQAHATPSAANTTAVSSEPGVADADRKERKDHNVQPLSTRTLNILFMDLSGWSKLTGLQLAGYLEKALPELDKLVKRHAAAHVNTWGDALIATFGSAKDTAECALDIRDFFRRTPESGGIPKGLAPRVAMHVGEAFIAYNPLLGRTDIFGHAVHLAARLEPVAGKGELACTKEFAVALDAIKGFGPVAHPRGTIELPKGFGRIEIFAVTGPGEDAPPAPVLEDPSMKPTLNRLVRWGPAAFETPESIPEFVQGLPHTRALDVWRLEFEFPKVAPGSYVYVAHPTAFGTARIGVGGIDGGFICIAEGVPTSIDAQDGPMAYTLLRSVNQIGGADPMAVQMRFFDLRGNA